MKKNKRIISAALAASMLLPCFATAAVSANAAVVSDENSVSVGDYDLMDNIQDGVILHCFNWKYNDIKAELNNIAGRFYNNSNFTCTARQRNRYMVVVVSAVGILYRY